jgi:hypothetical protein
MITITATETAKIYFKGTTVEIPSVVARIGGTIDFNGKVLPTVAEIFESVEAYEANPSNKLSVTGFETVMNFDLSNGDEPETWKPQTIQVAHDEFKSYLEGLGFTAVISGI